MPKNWVLVKHNIIICFAVYKLLAKNVVMMQFWHWTAEQNQPKMKTMSN